MPGAVQAAAPSTVLPWVVASLYVRASAYSQSRSLAMDLNTYADGSISTYLVNYPLTSRKSWVVSPRATAAQLTALRNFYNSQLGQLVEFFFYDVYETLPQFTYDDTGTVTTGRYTVRFRSNFVQSLQLARNSINNLQLVEVS